jgi:hypothetical protein
MLFPQMTDKPINTLYVGRITLMAFVLVLFASLQLKAQSVDLLTGRPQVWIPIQALTLNDVSVPISIYKSSSAFRVAEGEDNCGVGWGLSFGGSVTRIVRGLPDEVNTATSKGWLMSDGTNGINGMRVQGFNPIADDNLSICVDENADYTFLEGLVGSYKNDTEPDLFYINAPGLSVQFVYSQLGVPMMLNHVDVTIEGIPQYQSPTTFVVRSNTGLVYTFGPSANSTIRKSYCTSDAGDVNTACKYFNQEEELVFMNTWNLVSISSPKTSTTATFTYLTTNSNSTPEYGRQYYNFDSTSYTVDKYFVSKPQSVTLGTYAAHLKWTGGTKNHDRISEIIVENSLTTDKQITELEYSGVLESGNHSGYSVLKRLKRTSGYCSPVEIHEFDYYLETLGNRYQLPPYIKKSSNQDYFGYPNGQSGNWNKPTLYFLNNETDGRRLRVSPVAGSSPVIIAGNNRTPSASNQIGALKRITYPMGGYVEFEYEANQYTDYSVSPPQELTGDGPRVKKIISYGGEAAFGRDINAFSGYRAVVKEYEYKDASGNLSSGRLISPIKLGFILPTSIKQSVDNIGENPAVMYHRVKEKVTGKGYTVYEFNLPGCFPETSHGDWKATKSRIARKPGTSCVPHGQIKNGFYTFPYAPSSNYDFKRGQLARLAVYAENGNLMSEKVITYTTFQKNPSILKGLRFEKIGDIYYYGIYEILTGRTDVITSEIIKEASRVNPTRLFQTTKVYAYTPHGQLQQLTTTLPDNSIAVKKYTYARDFSIATPATTDTLSVAVKRLNETHQGNALLEEISYLTLPGSAQTVTGASFTFYRDFGNGQILPYYLKSLPPGASLTPASQQGQALIHDTDYKTLNTLRAYDGQARLLTQTDDKRHTSSTHYSSTLPHAVASFSNAAANQLVFDNFETASTVSLQPSGAGVQPTPGWTGQKGLSFTDNSSSLSSSSSNLVQKNGNKYRVSCWVKSSASRSLLVELRMGGSSLASLTLTNSNFTKWNYLEGEINITAVTGPFQVVVRSTNATGATPLFIDDFLLMPAHARVSLQTAHPLKGVTSTTDDQGHSAVTTYDDMGRPSTVLDQNRNLIQKQEYTIINRDNYRPVARFGSNQVGNYQVNQSILFTAEVPCDPTITYTWMVDGTAQLSTGSTLTYSFSTPGQHTVMLVLTNSSGASSSQVQTLCVSPSSAGREFFVSITDQFGYSISSYDCWTNPIPVINYSLSYHGPPLDSGCGILQVWTTTTQTTAEAITYYYTVDYTIDCSAFKDCIGRDVETTGTASGSLTYYLRTNCP